MAVNHHNVSHQNTPSQTLPMLNSGDMQPYVQGMNMSDFSFDINSSPPVGDLHIYEPDHHENSELHQHHENVTSSEMCDSTRLHPNDAYAPGGDSPPENMVIIPHFPALAPPYSEATISYPSVNDYPGNFNFEILLDGNGSGFKAWMYSYELNKVFIDIGKVLPIQVKLLYKQDERIPPLFLRATPIYSQDDFRGRPVERCPLHVIKENPTNEGFESVVKHIVRCTSSHCQYPMDERSGRYSCVTPLLPPQPGADTVTLMYSFVCKTSCLGGMDRRPVLLLLTLENQVGQILGRRSLSVKVCACPKRDKEKEEKEFQSSGATRRTKGRKRSYDTRIKEEMDDAQLANMGGDNSCGDLFNLGVAVASLPADHRFYLLDHMSTLLAGMYFKKGNEACRQAAEKCRAQVETLRTEMDPAAEPF